MIRQLLLDIDDTLLDFSQAEGWALRQAFAACGLTLSDDVFAQYRQINRRQWQRLDAGEITRDDLPLRQVPPALCRPRLAGRPRWRSKPAIGAF